MAARPRRNLVVSLLYDATVNVQSLASSISASAPPHANPATSEAIATLRAHPGFAQAMRASAAGAASMYQGGHLLNWLMDDRARLVFGYFALYLHFTRDPADPTSGLTPTRMKALCTEQHICSPGRAGAMLSLMRFAGYIEPDVQGADRRQRHFVATERLINLLHARWRVHYRAVAPLLPDGAAMVAALDDPAFVRRLILAMAKRFLSGFRFLAHGPGLGLFGERSGGMLILATLVSSGEADDTVPPSRPVPISISALARRFAVSRPHVLKLIQDASDSGLIQRTGADGAHVIIKPPFAEAAQNLFAAAFLFLADCAREAMRSPRG